MEKVIVNIEADILFLMAEVTEGVKGYDVYLGGGYLRDRYCNLPWKDVDIFLVPNGEPKDLLMYQPKGFRINYQKNTDTTGDMRKRGVEGLIGMSRPIVEDDILNTIKDDYLEVQFIIYDKFMSQEDLVKDMDINVNQIMWNPKDGETCASVDFVEGHEYESLEFMHEYDHLRMWHRMSRMAAKFPEYEAEEVDLTLEEELELVSRGDKEFEGSC